MHLSPESKYARIQIFYVTSRGGGVVDLPKTQIPYVWCMGIGERRGTFQLLMLSPNLPKTQIPYVP